MTEAQVHALLAKTKRAASGRIRVVRDIALRLDRHASQWLGEPDRLKEMVLD
jgi:hypothetical protein